MGDVRRLEIFNCAMPSLLIFNSHLSGSPHSGNMPAAVCMCIACVCTCTCGEEDKQLIRKEKGERQGAAS